MTSSLLQKSNIIYCSKEATSKDKCLKTQLLLSTGDKKSWNWKIWNKAGFSGNHTTDFTINKASFPENTLVYVNQGIVTLVKDEFAVYLDYVILG